MAATMEGFLEFIGGDQGVDARDVHLHDAAGADVEVADFAVAHLAVGQADEVLAGADEGVGILAQQLVVGGLAGQSDGVVGGFSAVAPSVEDG
jgi:broad specificity polyphosphatase/5'/3'-nucleotidase SurE